MHTGGERKGEWWKWGKHGTPEANFKGLANKNAINPKIRDPLEIFSRKS
jgi:hypothetical protein